jgi:hypothetical protein
MARKTTLSKYTLSRFSVNDSFSCQIQFVSGEA